MVGATEQTSSGGTTYAYAYDLAGNRTDGGLTYNAANQITNSGYAYDAAGNLTADGSATYTYDALSRMTARGTTTYSYNGDGVLVYDGTTRSTQDLASPLTQVLQTTQGSATTQYLYGLERLAAVAGGTRTWYGADALGSVRQTLSDTGTVLGTVNYDPWGTVESGSVPTFGFTGEVQDVGAGLVNLRARWYSTGRGRFTSADSWMGDEAHSQSLNLYGYVGGNPVGLTDPSGHCYPPIEYLRQLEPLNCSNLDQAARIINHPNASDGDKAKAGAYVGAWALGHAGVLVGLAFAGGSIAAEIGTAVASSTVGTAAGNVGLLIATWAANYAQAHPDVVAGIEAAGINITLQQAALYKDQTAQSILANPIGVIGCNLWGGLGKAALGALKPPSVGTTIPQGLSEMQYDILSTRVRSTVAQFGDDIGVQGSRAAGTARANSDIDIAIRVNPDRFDELVSQRFGIPNPGSAKERTMLHAMETGKIQAGEAGLSGFRRALEQELGIEVDLSIIRLGGPFDRGSWIPLK